jgi:hypothetical protein
MRTLPMLLMALLLGGCDDPGARCANEVLTETPSPDGHVVATTFRRNCGATTGYAQVVAVRPSGTAFNGDDDKTYVFLKDSDVPVVAAWDGPQVLRIRRKDGRVFLEIRVFHGMQIRYNDEP